MTTELARPEKRNRVAEESNDGVARAAAGGETNASAAAAANGSSAPAASAGAASNLIIQLVSETGETLGRCRSRRMKFKIA